MELALNTLMKRKHILEKQESKTTSQSPSTPERRIYYSFKQFYRSDCSAAID